MKLIAKFEDGTEVELKEIEGLNADSKVILMQLRSPIRPKDIEMIENALTEQIGIKVVLIDPIISKILSI